MKYFSAFTGVGGFDLGMPEGWECIGMSEIDKNANRVLKYRFKDVKNYGDIEKINWKEIPDFDLLVGGTPCQDLSIAGKRAGLMGGRSRLFFDFVNTLHEKRPSYFLWENVKGALSSNGGWDFARVLIEFSESGYDLWWQVLDATWFGIPQHRERVFVFGSLGARRFREVFFEPPSDEEDFGIQGQLANTIRSRYRGAQAVGNYVVKGKLQKIQNVHFDQQQYNRIYGTDGIAPTLHRKTGGRQVAKIVEPTADFSRARVRYLTPLECERLMGWPDEHTRYGVDEKDNIVELSDNARYNLIGNGVVPQVVNGILTEIMRRN